MYANLYDSISWLHFLIVDCPSSDGSDPDPWKSQIGSGSIEKSDWIQIPRIVRLDPEQNVNTGYGSVSASAAKPDPSISNPDPTKTPGSLTLA